MTYNKDEGVQEKEAWCIKEIEIEGWYIFSKFSGGVFSKIFRPGGYTPYPLFPTPALVQHRKNCDYQTIYNQINQKLINIF